MISCCNLKWEGPTGDRFPGGGRSAVIDTSSAPLKCTQCLLFMTLGALGRWKGALTIMACAAIFASVHRVHGDLILRSSHLENCRMALVAGKHLRMKLMTERHVSDALNFIKDGFLKGLHFMAQPAFGRRKCPLSIVARAAVSTLINRIHGHSAYSLLHRKDPHVALLAA